MTTTSRQGEQLAELRFASRADQLLSVRPAVRHAARQFGFEAALVEQVVLAVDEACANIIQHAYGPDAEGDIVLEILAQDDTLVFRLTDFSAPVDKNRIKGRSLDDIRPGGLGVYLMSQIMDTVTFLEPPPGAGNLLEMRKSRTTSANQVP